jgi:hypothetical protein
MLYIYYRIKELCIKLVIKTSLYYDARSEKHQMSSKLNVINLWCIKLPAEMVDNTQLAIVSRIRRSVYFCTHKMSAQDDKK